MTRSEKYWTDIRDAARKAALWHYSRRHGPEAHTTACRWTRESIDTVRRCNKRLRTIRRVEHA